MVLIFQTLIDLWRARLWELDRRWADLRVAPWHVAVERKVLRFLLRRHSDGPHAETPRVAEPLDEESAKAAQDLYLSDDARDQLGIPRLRRAIVRDPLPKPPPAEASPANLERRVEAKPPEPEVKPFDDPEKENSWQKLFGSKPKGGGSVWS